MSDLKLVKLPSAEDRRVQLVNELIDVANDILNGSIECDCYVFIGIDSRQSPPGIYSMDYNCAWGDAILGMREAERRLLSEAYDEYE